MMHTFSLSALDGFPEAVEVQGRTCAVYTDFRVILRILRMLSDAEVAQADKGVLLRRMFFRETMRDAGAEEAFDEFLRCGREKSEPAGEADFDYEQDAMEVYSAFRQVYGIDLMNAEMHWWAFTALLEGLFSGENALSDKVRMRHADDGEAQRKNALERRKRAVRLRQTVSRAEAAIEEQIRQRLLRGLPIEDLLGR
jgi:hypothetical protein